MNSSTKQIVREGDIVTMRLGFSEAVDYLRVAGTVRPVQIVQHMAQILNHDGTKFSFPVTLGEAGIYTDECGRHYVPSHEVIAFKARPQSTVILFVERRVGDRHVQCVPEVIIDTCLDRYTGDYAAVLETDEMGKRYRVTLPTNDGALLNPPPAVRLANLAKTLRIPATIED